MRGILHYDGSLFGLLSKIGDLAVLNLLVLAGSLPVVTIGAAMTAGHFAVLKMVRNEGSVFSDFRKSFVSNLRQGTVLWLGLLTLGALCLLGIHAFSGTMPMATVALGVVLLLTLLVSLWAFPVLSKFEDAIGRILQNGAVLCFRHLFRSLAMLLSYLIIPLIILIIGFEFLPVWILYGFSLPMWISAKLYNSVFADLEQQVLSKMQQNKGAV